MEVISMLGWMEAEPPADGFSRCFVFMKDEVVPLGSIALLTKEMIKQISELQESAWVFECCREKGRIELFFFDATLPVEEVKAQASCTLARLMRNNETLH